jgi:hypothetical protein
MIATCSSPNINLVLNKNEMGGAYSTYGAKQRGTRGFGDETLGLDGRMLLKWIFRKMDRIMD